MKKIISRLEIKTVFNRKIALARSLLALGTLLTIIFNTKELTNINLLFQAPGTISLANHFDKFSIFRLLGPNWGEFVSIIILVSVFTGYYAGITSILHSWVNLSVCWSFILIDGGDQITSNLSILLIPICLFDRRKNLWHDTKIAMNDREKAVNVFFNVYYFLVLLQVAVIYLHAAVGKLGNSEWLDGTCSYYWFTNNVFGAPLWLQKIYGVITLSKFVPIFTWSVVIFELGLFACLLTTNIYIKKTFLRLGIIFHLGIAITHGLPSFFFAMSGALILYLGNTNTINLYILNIKKITHELRKVYC